MSPRAHAEVRALLSGFDAPTDRCPECLAVLVSAESRWMQLGIAPVPESAWQGFWHHVAHGMLMRFPLRRVVVWSWRHRRSWLKHGARS